ncbi:MAG: DUF1549 domain-containing protein [Pirellulales bacterium]|nr:DUF1549 domain-containing protein [Pirellulales bacterium]
MDANFNREQLRFWAFQPINASPVPPVVDESWPANDVDRFILARLETAGLRPARPADRLTLLRRITFDLTGLPPKPEEIVDFLKDDMPDAYARVVDRLLASPRYGERWAQHWLDAVRFAESAGHDGNNAYLHAWRYRDYVINALNEDKPFDQFVVEQLAGDLLETTGDAEQDFAQLVATGFLQVGPKPVVMRDKRQMLLDIADEQLSATSIALMGLTVGCARCHDHKFDPIPTADYYSLAGIFASTAVMADEAPDSKWIEKAVQDPTGREAKIMVVRDSPSPKNLRIHRRGSYQSLGPEVPRRFLQIIAGAENPPIEGAVSGRLALARWLVDGRHPLTARVMVNRIWQHHFDRGLVATSGNFGKLGSRPTHPKLLDWLAVRFMESGWSVKAMHRLIVLSNTYQQAYADNALGASSDPENDLLWRMRRRRLSAEEIRDALLDVSGQLDLAMGGTLFNEGYTPVDASRELFTVDISGKDIFPPFQHPRRSIYLPVIRNSRPEALKLFDVANEHEPSPVRGETTVAPQALFLINSTFARRAAGWFAVRSLQQASATGSGDSLLNGAVRYGYLRALGREAASDEVERALDFIEAYAETAQSAFQLASLSAEDAAMVDEIEPLGIEPYRFLGLRACCQSLFCLNQFIYVD